LWTDNNKPSPRRARSALSSGYRRAYTLAAFVTQSEIADKAVEQFLSALSVSLAQGVSLIPLTPQLIAELQSGCRPDLNFEFEDLPALITCAAKWAELISRSNPVAFLEAEFFGGVGSQAAIGWQDGKITFGTLQTNDAINQALRWLGISSAGHMDEFDTLALGRHRDTESWTKG
jgi:hypothetical protein